MAFLSILLCLANNIVSRNMAEISYGSVFSLGITEASLGGAVIS